MPDSLTLAQRLQRLTSAQRALLAVRLQSGGTAVPPHARLAVCVALREGASLNEDAVRAFARQRLPDYMLPQVITLVEELPRTSAGKIDRRALHALAATPVAGASDLVAPASAAEKTLAAIWCEVLGLEEVGVNDDFFEVGGDSLLSIRILSRASRAGLVLDPEAFFAHPTIASQAALAQPPKPEAVPDPDADAAPAPPAQKFPLANLSAGELDGLSKMLDTLDGDD